MRIPGGFDALFRQLTPVFLLLVLVAVVFEPWLPGTGWLRAHLGDDAVLRACTAALAIYVLLLWGESLRLHTILTGVLQAFREFDASGGGGPKGARNPRARFEAARLLIAALESPDASIRDSSRANLTRLVGKDLGPDAAAWRQWLAAQEPRTDGT